MLPKTPGHAMELTASRRRIPAVLIALAWPRLRPIRRPI
jgi:hypothetical protein